MSYTKMSCMQTNAGQITETYNQFLRAHHRVNRKNAARTRHATLLALVSNPHVIKQAPMNEEPRYPAGRVIQGMPPDIRVSPPSSATYQGEHSSITSQKCCVTDGRAPQSEWSHRSTSRRTHGSSTENALLDKLVVVHHTHLVETDREQPPSGKG